MKAIKNVLYLLAAFVTVMLSSCSNDDMHLDISVNFNVDPSSVVSSFVEVTPGDISNLAMYDAKLRIRLFIYNEQGNLVVSDYAFSNDYTHIKQFKVNLPNGKYTTVAITDVVFNDGTETYTLSRQDNLTTMTLTYRDSIGGIASILGLTAEQRQIDSYSKDFVLKVKPAGALIVCRIDNWNCNNSIEFPFDNITKYHLVSNKLNSGLTLDSYGNPLYSVNTTSILGYHWFSESRHPAFEFGHGYQFQFPTQNVSLMFLGVNSKNQTLPLGKSEVFDIVEGEEYYIIYDKLKHTVSLKSNVTAMVMKKAHECSAVMTDSVYDFTKQSLSIAVSEGVSIKPIDYLKQKQAHED